MFLLIVRFFRGVLSIVVNEALYRSGISRLSMILGGESGASVPPFYGQLVSFELLCLERRAVLLDFCETWELDEIIHLDSDGVLFDSIDEGASWIVRTMRLFVGAHLT